MGEHYGLAIHHRLGHHFRGFSCSYRSGQRRSAGCRHLIIRREPRRPAARFGREYPRAKRADVGIGRATVCHGRQG